MSAKKTGMRLPSVRLEDIHVMVKEPNSHGSFPRVHRPARYTERPTATSQLPTSAKESHVNSRCPFRRHPRYFEGTQKERQLSTRSHITTPHQTINFDSRAPYILRKLSWELAVSAQKTSTIIQRNSTAPAAFLTLASHLSPPNESLRPQNSRCPLKRPSSKLPVST